MSKSKPTFGNPLAPWQNVIRQQKAQPQPVVNDAATATAPTVESKISTPYVSTSSGTATASPRPERKKHENKKPYGFQFRPSITVVDFAR